MPKYTVRIETSVSVEAFNALAAAQQAKELAEESLSESNALVRVYEGDQKKLGRKVLDSPIEEV